MHKTIYKIAGKPNFKILKKLQKRTKANAASVISSLGGGLHGHLGLVISTSKYSNISGCHFIRPVHPGKLTIPEKSLWRATKTLSWKNAVENVIKRQIIGAVESVYSTELINS